MKFDSKAYETKLIDELDIVLHTKSKDVLSKINTSSQFQDVLKKEFNILFYLISKKKSTSVLPKKLLAKFNELSKTEFKINEKYKPTDNYQMVDDINYLSIYIKNIFKVNLHDLSKLDTVKVEEQHTTQTRTSSNGSFAANMQNNPFLQAPAQMRLQADIRTGKVYPYKTKPALILNIKKIMNFLLLIFSISLILTGIFMIACVSIKDGIIDKDGQQQTIPTAFSGVMYIVIALFFCYYSYKIYRDVYDNKRTNDCLKYRFDYNSMFFPIFLFVFYVVFDLFYIKYANNVWFFQSFDSFVKANMNVVTQLWGWAVCKIITLVLFAAVVVTIIIAKVYNPKPDTEKLRELLSQYIDEMSRAAGGGF